MCLHVWQQRGFYALKNLFLWPVYICMQDPFTVSLQICNMNATDYVLFASILASGKFAVFSWSASPQLWTPNLTFTSPLFFLVC